MRDDMAEIIYLEGRDKRPKTDSPAIGSESGTVALRRHW